MLVNTCYNIYCFILPLLLAFLKIANRAGTFHVVSSTINGGDSCRSQIFGALLIGILHHVVFDAGGALEDCSQDLILLAYEDLPLLAGPHTLRDGHYIS